MNEKMLVSVVVVTYNSAYTVLETLESIKQQTYDRIELIVSDDCSKDDTVAVCQKWLNENEQRFVHFELITVEINTGVCANLNRAIAATKGEWIKIIAGDDILFDNCINDYVTFVKEQPDVKWASSYIRNYDTFFNEEYCVGRQLVLTKEFFNLQVKEQLAMMAKRCILYAPSMFYNTEMLKGLGGFDERYIAEDHPFYIKALENGYKCYLLNKETVGYRIHSSLCRKKGALFNAPFKKQMRLFRKEKCFKYLSFKERTGLIILWEIEDIIVFFKLNHDNRIMSFLYKGIRWAIRSIFHVYW